jgi:dephospho-CoA kinase
MTKHHVPRLGITGGIGSGKSTALAFLRELGAAVVSTDDIVHGLLSDPAIAARVVEHFGESIVDGDRLNRPALARIVFDDERERVWLESLLHPLVKKAVDEWARAQERAPGKPSMLVVEVPLLFETGMESVFDHVLLVTAPEPMRRKRLVAKLTDSEFGKRSAQQLDEQAKAARSEFVFVNTGSRKHLKEFVAETYAAIIAAAGEQNAAHA